MRHKPRASGAFQPSISFSHSGFTSPYLLIQDHFNLGKRMVPLQDDVHIYIYEPHISKNMCLTGN